MTATGVQDLCLEWPAKQRMIPTVACTPAPGRTLADWESFVLTIREDPLYPRSGGNLSTPLDPYGDGWAVVAQATGVNENGVNVAFEITVPAAPGKRRYVMDVRGVGGTAGEVAFIPATWLSVGPSVR